MSLNAKKALELISGIPAEKFITHSFTNEKDCCCVQGHLCRLTSENPNDYSRDNCSEWKLDNDSDVPQFREKSQKFIKEVYGINYIDYSIADVNNDNTINGYTQESIKDRIVAFLIDMSAWEEKKTIQE